MVNVTKDNFIEQSNDLLRHLPTAAFVAIDEEMTGISLPGRSWRQPKDETPSQRYKADLKQVPERYSIIQFGVCLFHSTAVDTIPTSSSDARAGDEHVEWKVRRYNFWMFPNEKSSREIVMSPSAVKFLNDNGMNFDQWTKKGVHFVSCNEACATLKKFVEKTRQAQDLQQAQDNSRQPPETLDQASRPRVELRRPEDIDFFSRTMAHLREWLDAAIPQHARHGHAAPPHLAATWEGSSTLLPECNAFLRRALYESIEQEYPSLVLESARSEGYPNRIRVFRLNEEEKARRRIRLRRLSWNELIEKKIGMTRIFCALARVASGLPLDRHSILFAPSIDHVGCWNEEHIASASFVPGILEDEDATLDDDDASQYHHHCEAAAAAAATNASTGAGRKVPIIVHNGFMDLCFLFTHFVNPTLPDHLVDVKSMIRKCFPIVYDTKILATETAAVDGPGGGGGMGTNNTRLGSLFERYANLRRAGDAYRPLVDREIRIQPPYRAAAEAGVGGGPDNVNDNADYNYDRDDDDDIDQEHAASYDAYMTGFVFTGLIRDVQAVHRLPLRPERDEEERRANGGDDGDSRSEHSVHGSDDSEDGEEEEGELTLGQVESNLQRLVSFISQDETSTESCDHDLRVLFGRNRLFQMSMYTMDLEEPSMRDPLSRGMRGESAFRISGFDPNISTRDIVRCLAGLVDRRGRRVNFEILWINDTTFIVAACWRPAPPAMVAANAAAVARGQARAAAAAALNAAVARVVANRNNDNDNGGAPGAAVIEFAAAQVAADRNNRVPAAAVAAAAVAAAAGARIAADRNNNNNGNGGPEAVRAAVAGALNDAIAAAGANQNDNGGAAGGVDVAAAADRIADGAAAAAAALNAAADAGAAAAANQNDDDENEEEEEEEDSTTIIREHGQLIRDALATRFSSETITNLNDYMDSLEEAEAAAVVAAAGLSEKDSSAASSWASRIWSMLGFGDKKRAAEQNDGEEESRANKRRRLNP